MISFEELKATGFVGFYSLGCLRDNLTLIPNVPGIYLILAAQKIVPQFIDVGTGGVHKGKNPNVSIKDLMAKWVADTHVLYVGKAGANTSKTHLRKRLQQYFQFGLGRNIGHYGGRYIWQIKDAADLIVAWKPTFSEEPRKVEKEFLREFEAQYSRLPFANLKR